MVMMAGGDDARGKKGDAAAGKTGRPQAGGAAGGREWSPRLYLPAGRDGRGFLIFSPSSAETALIELTPALVRPILALHAARLADARLPPEARGWLSAAKLAEAIAGQDPRLLPAERQTMHAYICKLNAYIRRAAGRAGWPAAPVLIECRRLLGFRLATDNLAIIDGTEAGQARKQPPSARGRRTRKKGRGTP
jgi:hypothetical protein